MIEIITARITGRSMMVPPLCCKSEARFTSVVTRVGEDKRASEGERKRVGMHVFTSVGFKLLTHPRCGSAHMYMFEMLKPSRGYVGATRLHNETQTIETSNANY